MEPLWWFTAKADAGRRTGEDEVTGVQLNAGREVSHERRHVEDEVAGILGLLRHAVDVASDVEPRGRAELVR